MGVKGLYSYVKPYRNHVEFDTIPHGSKIGVDALSLLYHFRGNQETILKFIQPFLDRGCKLLFVFDGPAPEAKAGELEERQKKRERARAEVNTIREFLDSAQELEPRARQILSQKISQLEMGAGWHLQIEKRKEIQQLLWEKGASSVKAIGEADDVLVGLWKQGHIYSILSTDMDFLVHGVERVWIPTYNTEFEEIKLSQVLEKEELTQKQLVEASILCSAVSSQTAFQWIRYYGTLANLFKFQPEACSLKDTFIQRKLDEYSSTQEPITIVKEKHKEFLEAFLRN
jgi:5'-3' exonuclease